MKNADSFFCTVLGVARNGKQGECIDARYFCARRGPQKCLLGSLTKPGRPRDKVSRSGGVLRPLSAARSYRSCTLYSRPPVAPSGWSMLTLIATDSIPRGGRLLGCCWGLRRSGSAFPGRRFALGYFVPRLRLGFVRGRFVSLGWAAPAGLGRILCFVRLLALIRGRSLFRGLALRRPIPGSGKIHHLSSGGGISHAGDRGLFLVLF